MYRFCEHKSRFLDPGSIISYTNDVDLNKQISLFHIKLFRDIVQQKSLTRGARLNGITQSAASQHLQLLEDKLGEKLIDRSVRPFRLTAAGKLYYEFCKDIYLRVERFRAQLEELKGQMQGVVRVASIYSVGLSELSYLSQEFSRRYPDCKLEVEYLRPDRVYTAVEEGRVDLGIVSYPESRRHIAVMPWRLEEMHVVVSPDHPLAIRDRVAPEELCGLEFVAFDDALPIRREIDRYLREHGVEVKVVLHFDNIQSVKEAVAYGAGISILPVRSLRAEIREGRLKAIPLTDPLLRPLGILYLKKKVFNKATQAFLELLQEQPVEPESLVLMPVGK